MKNKIGNLLKALGAFVALLLLLFYLLVSVVAFLFPAVISDWMYTVMLIIEVPLAIVYFVTVLKEWRNQRRAKKEARKKK
jgi:hypothetical protein